MIPSLQNLLLHRETDVDGIYLGMLGAATEQTTEIELRERVASAHYDNYLEAVSFSHSIPVMDQEVSRFLANMPHGALILDIGGCWGWHWRHLAKTRPDVGVLVVDFVRSNLPHARNVLDDLIGRQVALMHADATALPFMLNADFAGFDGVWTVQTFQHIPDFEKAVLEAHRVLKKGGSFANYSLNIQPPVRWLRSLLGKGYLTKGWVEGVFWLARASAEQREFIQTIFGSPVSSRWSEILFSPEFRFTNPGRQGGVLGSIDALLSNGAGFFGWFARQRSFHCKKL